MEFELSRLARETCSRCFVWTSHRMGATALDALHRRRATRCHTSCRPSCHGHLICLCCMNFSRALKSQRCQHCGHSFYVRRDQNHNGYGFLGYGFLGYGFLGYGFLTEATAALVITLACLLLGRDQHSAAVDDRGSSDSITAVERAHRHDEP